METVTDFIFLGSKITADSDCNHEIKMVAPWKKSYDKPRQSIKKQRHHFVDKCPYNQSYGFSSECECEVAQLCPTLCNPMDCILPSSSVHGIFQARVLELGAISFSRRSFQPRDWTQVSRIVGRCFTIWATREASIFPVVMCKYVSWTVKKAEGQTIHAFEWGVGEDSWESLGLQGDQTS